MTIAIFVSIIAVCITLTHIDDSHRATVDNRVPLPLQVGSKSNPKYSSNVDKQRSMPENKALLPETSSDASKSSSSSLINDLGEMSNE